MKNINPSLVTDPTDQLSIKQENSFSYLPKPVVIEKGDRAFRFCMHQGYPMSEFWFLKESYDELFSIYISELVYSREMTMDESPRQRFSRILQNNAAVLHRFDKDSDRDFFIVGFTVKLTFKTDVIGYVGFTTTKQTFMPANKNDIQSYNKAPNPINLKAGDERVMERKQGGLQQLVIPRFRQLLDQHNIHKIDSLVEKVVVPF